MIIVGGTPILDTPVGKAVFQIIESGAWNKTSEGHYNRLPTNEVDPPFGETGCAVAVTQWMVEDGVNIFDAAASGVPAVPTDWFAAVTSGGGAQIVAEYLRSCAGFVANVPGSSVSALKDVDWTVPFGVIPWAWLRSHASSIDWTRVVNAITAPEPSRPKNPSFRTFGLYTWLGNIPGTTLAWKDVPYEVFVLPSMAAALHLYPWEGVDFTSVDPSTEGLLAAIGVSSAPSDVSPFPSPGPGVGSTAGGHFVVDHVPGGLGNIVWGEKPFVPANIGAAACKAGEIYQDGACVKKPASGAADYTNPADSGSSRTGLVVGAIVIGLAGAIFAATLAQKPKPVSFHQKKRAA